MEKKEFSDKYLSKGRTFSFLFSLCIIICVAIISSGYDTFFVPSFATINKHVSNQTICVRSSTIFSDIIVPSYSRNNGQSFTPPQRNPFPQYNGEIVSDAISDSIVLSKKMNRVELDYWNIFTKECDEYFFSYSQNPHKLTLKSSCPVDSAPIMEIKSDSAISLFVNSINRFYILKTDEIVIKRINKTEEIESDFETLHINLYTQKGKRIFASTMIESGYYELIFNPDFKLFVDLLNELILQYDSLFMGRIIESNNSNIYKRI